MVIALILIATWHLICAALVYVEFWPPSRDDQIEWLVAWTALAGAGWVVPAVLLFEWLERVSGIRNGSGGG